jgi:transmembrane sensor
LWNRGAGKVQVAARTEPSLVQLADGSLAQALDATSRLQLVTTQPDRVLIHLRGAASFHVQKNPKRLYRVETDRVAVEVLGTRFVVKELLDHRVHVEVSEGRVRVLWDKQQRELSAGTSGDFPAVDAAAPSERPAVSSSVAGEASHLASGSLLDPPSVTQAPSEPTVLPQNRVPKTQALPSVKLPALGTPTAAVMKVESWQSLAEQGKFELAYAQAFVHGSPRDGELDPVELLLLADVARFSGHPSDAVPPLRRLLRVFPTDPRSPLASFTLGRILLDDLGQPREAAESFHHVGELDPEGPLTQDALGREVEAWSRAGEQSLARSRAEEYLRRYPSGRRLRSVKRYGSLD